MRFAPGGLDAALVLAGGRGRDEVLATMRKGGRVAYPNGVEPEPHAPEGVACAGLRRQAEPATPSTGSTA